MPRWLRRVGGYLIDFAPAYLAQIPFWIGYVMFYVRLIQLSQLAVHHLLRGRVRRPHRIGAERG